MKGLVRASYDGSAMWNGWRGIGLLRVSMSENVLVIAQWVGHREGMIKEKRGGCQTGEENGPGYE